VDSRSPLRFSLDSSLGRLARYLRLLGHDAAWVRGDSLECAISRARAEGRVLLTRSSDFIRLDLTMPIAGGMIIASSDQTSQLAEVGSEWPVFSQARPFSRCADCNEPLLPMSPAEAQARVPVYVAATQDSFQTCLMCTRVFWKGTHAERLLELFDEAASRCSQEIPAAWKRRSARPDISDPALPNG
jgi:uncharacterized protein